MNDLSSCPFCGQRPVQEPWHGGGPLKVMIGCVGRHPDENIALCAVAPMVTGETAEEAALLWNTRAPARARDSGNVEFDVVDDRLVPMPGWCRDNETTYLRLMLVWGHSVSEQEVAGWTDEQCREAEVWACSIHLSADHDDIIVPERPSFITRTDA